MLKYLDLFAGIGGFAKGIEMAGVKIESHYFSEIDKYAKSIYKRHWPDAIDLGAVEHVRGDEYPSFDLVTFGFPCQDISIAGKRAGLEGRRSNLFYQAMRIIRENRPRGFILENVQGLFSSNGGKDFIAVLREIADIGLYECQWQLVNTAWFLPQNRERIILIGRFGGERGPEVFPIRENGETNHRERQHARCLSGGAHSGGLHSDMNGIRLKDTHIRRLTPVECERLQGFPDGWTKYGIDEDGKKMKISDTRRYKALGNAVSTNVIQKIITRWFCA